MPIRHAFILLLCIFRFIVTVQAQTDERPLVLPMADPPGPSTWLFGQAYGNTVGAFNFGSRWYSAGQGLHFGLDFPMPCGTTLVAVADGEVAHVDNLNFGSAPHNVILRHPQLGISTLYGHLLNRSPLVQGQLVEQGQIIGQSGDPDETCDSRPHLHLEIRSLDYRTTYNPVDYIDANWHTLALIGGYSYPLFQQDVYNARRWLSLGNQPNVSFGGIRLNNYTLAYPLPGGQNPPPNPPLSRESTLLPDATTWQLRKLGYDLCCWKRWWHPVNPDVLYVIDGGDNQQAAIYRWSAEAGAPVDLEGAAPPSHRSPDNTYEIGLINGVMHVRNRIDGSTWSVPTDGAPPALSTDNNQMLWIQSSSITLPGQDGPDSTVWLSDIRGDAARQIYSAQRASGRWLDAYRVLLSSRVDQQTTLLVFDTRDDSMYMLGEWRSMRGLSVSPGGKWLMFYITAQDNAANDGVYVIEASERATPAKTSWFGAWRWRDNDSVYYVPYEPYNSTHRLAYYHIPTGETRLLTDPGVLPFTIMNGDWEVSADGRRIVFQNAVDSDMWLLEIAN